jgi:hypothetical protein
VIKPRLRLLDTEAIAHHFKVATGTIRRWASEDHWHAYGPPRTRQWDLAEAQRSYEKRRRELDKPVTSSEHSVF